jgi:hypothetical protein
MKWPNLKSIQLLRFRNRSASASLDHTRRARLPIRTRRSLRRLTNRNTLIQVANLRIQQARVLNERRVYSRQRSF